MIIKKTKLSGVYTINLELRSDQRGFFARNFCLDELKKAGIKFRIVQINKSLTKQKGTIRGLHFQKSPRQEDKLIQCLKGEIFDVAVDLRKNSPTYGQWIGEILSEDNKKMFLIPKGFAHGFQALTPNCLVQYFVTQYYTPEKEAGRRWNDPNFNINWPIKKAILSKKDQIWPIK